MAANNLKKPKCIVIAGPNGAGKTTFAREYLQKELGIAHFVNADLIAGGISALNPALAALKAGKVLLGELEDLSKAGLDFGFESTLSGGVYATRLRNWKSKGYHIEIIYLRLNTPQLALRRIAARVKQGGHDVKREDVIRRFHRGWEKFESLYKPLADAWAVYDNSGKAARLLEKFP
jgi:predicted ABC-type ATPase